MLVNEKTLFPSAVFTCHANSCCSIVNHKRFAMNDNSQSYRNVLHVQKKIVELTRQYYQAIRDNITFENIKVIFLKRKKLKDELLNLKEQGKEDGDTGGENVEAEWTI